MAFKNPKASKRLNNLINGGNDEDYLKKLNGEEDEEIVEEPKRKAPPKRKTAATRSKRKDDVKFEIVETFYSKDIGTSGKWKTELNKVSWNGETPVFDLRSWGYDEDGNRQTAGKGIVLQVDDFGDMLDTVIGEFYDFEED